MKRILSSGIIISYAFFSVLILVISIVAYYGSRNTAKNLETYCENMNSTNYVLHVFKENMVLIQNNLRYHIIVKSSKEKDSIEKVIDFYRVKNEKILALLLRSEEFAQLKDILNELSKQREENIRIRNKLFDWSRRNQDSAYIFNSKYQVPSYFHYYLASDDLFDKFVSKESKKNSNKLVSDLNSKRKILIPLLVLLFLITTYIGKLVWQSQRNLIEQIDRIKVKERILNKAQEISKTGSWERDFTSQNSLIFSDEFYRIFEADNNDINTNYEFLLSRVHYDDRERLRKIHIDNIVKKIPYQCSYKLLFDEFRIKYIEEQADILCDETGNPIKSAGVVMDVTDKILSGIKIKQTEKVFHELFENIADGVYKSTLKGKFVDVNPAMVKMLGYASKEELLKIDIAKDLYFSDKDREKALHADELGKIVVLKLKKKDGTELYAEDRSYNITDESGNVLYNQGILRDVTEKLKAEKDLKEKEQFNRGLLNSLTQHIAVINSKGDIISVNDAWREFAKNNGDTTLSRTAEGTNYFEVCMNSITNGDMVAAEALAGIKLVINKKSNLFMMEYPCHSSEDERWFLLRASMFRSGENLVVISHDNITVRKKAELEKERITNDLLIRNKDLEHFAFIVSHNLRAPVATIIGISDLLLNPEITEDVKQMTTKGLMVSTQKLDDVVKDLNKILQVREQVNEKKSDVNLQEILGQVERNLILLIENAEAKINADFSAFSHIHSIKSYMYSIFYHLITNSIKYSKPNENPVIEISNEIDEESAIIHFKDNGIGFNLEQNSEKVFGLYNRFNTEIDGKGLGLYLVKMQVEALGGTIFLKSELNQGSEFLIKFDKEIIV